jgi:hypothetical protein
MRTHAFLLPLLACAGCDYTALTTEVGEQVVYHWDASEKQIYGGTVATADRLMEAIPAYYGLPLVRAGPKTEYFWGSNWQSSGVCAPGTYTRACARGFGSGFTVFANNSIHAHELAHTVDGGHNGPPFVNEGFAQRWESTLIDGGVVPSWEPLPLSEEVLRTQLQLSSPAVDHHRAFAWWVALETHYGPAKLGEFIVALGPSASADEVEVALQRVLGITLAESAALAAALPAKTSVIDPACELRGLPTMVWNDNTLVIDRGDAHFGDPDIANWAYESEANWLFAIEFPVPGVLVEMSVTVPKGMADRQDGRLNLGTCTPGILSADNQPTYRYFAVEEGSPDRVAARWVATGRWVGGLVATPDARGSITFPRVVFEEQQP